MLYIVATPIGNLEDITLRAISVLRSADFILAEDTRVTRVLLDKYVSGVPEARLLETSRSRASGKRLISYHQHSGFQKIEEIIGWLKEGKNLALVTDAGTPGINDPGNYLVAKALEAIPDLKIVPIPGANAAITALSVSGFSSDKFIFLGFPPHKKGRRTFFQHINLMEDTIVFYESKYRIVKALKEMQEFSAVGARSIMVARELTKQFETIYRGTVDEIMLKLNKNKNDLLGEFVVVIGPRKQNMSEKISTNLGDLEEAIHHKEIAGIEEPLRKIFEQISDNFEKGEYDLKRKVIIF